MKFDDIFLYSDIDGTLGVAEYGIPQKNKDAIEYFVRNGGKFGLATGRHLSDITHFIGDLPVNAVSIINNGAAIYDFEKKIFLKNIALPNTAFYYCYKAIELYPDICIISVTKGGYAVSYKPPNDTLSGYVGSFPYKDIKKVDRVCYKFLFCVKNNALGFAEKLRAISGYDVEYVQSGEHSIEMLPAGINKGTGFEDVCRIQKIIKNNTYFLGDSFNDKEIMQLAGYSGCVGGSNEELQKICDFNLCGVKYGAVEHMIKIIEERVKKQLTLKRE